MFNVAQFWDGRAEDLKAQAKGPVQAGVEMANVPPQVVATLKSMPEYVERFGRAFPGEVDPVTFDNMAKAIEAFEVTLVTPARASIAGLRATTGPSPPTRSSGSTSSSTRAAPPATAA